MEQTLLVAEDSPVFRDFYAAILKDAPFETAFAVNGKEAVGLLEQLLSNGREVAIITDVSMPVMNGFQILRYVRDNHPSVKVIMASAHADAFYSSTAKRRGAFDYIVKDSDKFSAENITKLVTTVFNQEKAP